MYQGNRSAGMLFYNYPSPRQRTTLDLIIHTCTHYLWHRYTRGINEVSTSNIMRDRQEWGWIHWWGYHIISSKHLVGKCMMNGRHIVVECFRRVTIATGTAVCQRDIHSVAVHSTVIGMTPIVGHLMLFVSGCVRLGTHPTPPPTPSPLLVILTAV